MRGRFSRRQNGRRSSSEDRRARRFYLSRGITQLVISVLIVLILILAVVALVLFVLRQL
jgi:hypothetical protein